MFQILLILTALKLFVVPLQAFNFIRVSKDLKTKQSESDIVEYYQERYDLCGNFNFTEAQTKTLADKHWLSMSLPWAVYIIHKTGGKFVPVCMGTLLTDIGSQTDHVMTLQSCVPENVRNEEFYVYTGVKFPIDESDKDNLYKVTLRRTKVFGQILEYPVVIIIEKAIPIEGARQTACLPTPIEKIPEKEFCVVSVLQTVGREQYSPALYTVKYENNEACKKIGKKQQTDAKREFCAVDQFYSGMIAKGGPLMCINGGYWYLYGAYTWSMYNDEQSESFVESKEAKPANYFKIGPMVHILQKHRY